MERPVKVRFVYNEDNEDKKKIVDTYIQTANDGGDSKSYISNKRKLTKLGQLSFISYSDREIERQTVRDGQTESKDRK